MDTSIVDKVQSRKEESNDNDARGDKGVNGLWWRGAACIFDMWFTETEAAKYLGVLPKTVLEKQ